MPTQLFLSYHFADEAFAERLARHLLTQRPWLNTWFYQIDRRAGEWEEQVGKVLRACDYCIAVVGKELGATQMRELALAREFRNTGRIWIRLPDGLKPGNHEFGDGIDPIRVESFGDDIDRAARTTAQTVVKMLGKTWVEVDDLPAGYPFQYEKDIVEVFRAAESSRQAHGRDTTSTDYELREPESKRAAVPLEWPGVFRWPDDGHRANPVSANTIGAYREHDRAIIVHPVAEASLASLVLPEAGPRRTVIFPERDRLKVGIVVSGGIAPGINAVISGIIQRHQLYADPPEGERNPDAVYRRYDVSVGGYLEGFKSLLRGDAYHRGNYSVDLSRLDIDAYAHRGGSVIGTSRADELLKDPPQRVASIKRIVHNLAADGIDILYVIGGDGSMRAAHAIYSVAQQMRHGGNVRKLSVVGVPKTMDNDILWVWQSFGFLSAVEKARECIMHLNTEIRSNPRLCVVQLFGSDSGFVVAHAVLGSGECDYALIPEVGFTMKVLCEHMLSVLRGRKRTDSNPYGMIIMSEAAIPRDVDQYVDEPYVGLTDAEKRAIHEFISGKRSDGTHGQPWRVSGQTPDELRTGGLKVVAKVLEHSIRRVAVSSDPSIRDSYWQDFRVLTNEPRHILRSTPPSVSDVIFGQRMGALAVDNAMAGYSDFMVSQWLTEFVLVPLKLVVLGRKRLPPSGIFWKSVLASTQQPVEDLSALTREEAG